MTRICDYEGSRYRTEFWENGNRQYEDLAERIALKHMLPARGWRLIEIGAGFGRLADMYGGYEQVVLVDYARTQMEEARRYLGNDDRFMYVVADVYNLPFADDLFDALVMIRVMHHLTAVPAALTELRRVMAASGTAVIEHASKCHTKAILRWWLRRQNWNPFDLDPHEFVELNIDFHPKWMRRQFTTAGFSIEAIRTVSHYRLAWLKRLIPAGVLAWLDGLAQPSGRWWQITPSVFLQAAPNKETSPVPAGIFFKCPACGNTRLQPAENSLDCPACRKRWEFKDGIYNFKTPLADS